VNYRNLDDLIELKPLDIESESVARMEQEITRSQALPAVPSERKSSLLERSAARCSSMS
jgi:hypothetical protein